MKPPTSILSFLGVISILRSHLRLYPTHYTEYTLTAVSVSLLRIEILDSTCPKRLGVYPSYSSVMSFSRRSYPSANNSSCDTATPLSRIILSVLFFSISEIEVSSNSRSISSTIFQSSFNSELSWSGFNSAFPNCSSRLFLSSSLICSPFYMDSNRAAASV